MNSMQFAGLCLKTAEILRIPEAESFSNGEVVTLNDIDIELIRDGSNGHLARLYLGLGELDELDDIDKVEVYEALFSIQLMMESVVDGQFVLDNLHDRMMFMARLPLSEQTQAEQLAAVIRSFLQQVKQWRSTILRGTLFEDDFDEQQVHYPDELQAQSRTPSQSQSPQNLSSLA